MNTLDSRIRTTTQNLLICIAFSLLIGIGAHVSIPCYPVPFTLQTMCVFAVAAHLGAKLGALTVIIYLAEGLIGLPVFASPLPSPAAILGPTGGYLIGFIPAAYVMGLVKERFTGFISAATGIFLAELILFFFGWLQLAQFVGYSAAYHAGIEPFYLSELIKMTASIVLISRM